MSDKDGKPEPKSQQPAQAGFSRDPNRMQPTNRVVAAHDSASKITHKIVGALRNVEGGKKK